MRTSALIFSSPETFTDSSDISTEKDNGKFFHQDEPHDELVKDRQYVPGEPWDERWFTKPPQHLDDLIRFPVPSQTRDRSSAIATEFSEDYMDSGLDVSPPPVQPTERHLKRRKIEPNYIEDFVHREQDIRPRNVTPYGSMLVFGSARSKFSDEYYSTFWTIIPENFRGAVVTARDQGMHTQGVLAFDDESYAQSIDAPEGYGVQQFVVPPELKYSVLSRINPNVYIIHQLPRSWFVER